VWFNPASEDLLSIKANRQADLLTETLGETLHRPGDEQGNGKRPPVQSAQSRRQDRPVPESTEAGPPKLPRWVLLALPRLEANDGPFWINSKAPEGTEGLDPISLQVLRDFIEENGLTEDSSAFDRDDGNGRFEPWELGSQLWQDGQLVVLSFGSSPYLPYGYALESVPRSIEDLVALEYLDLGGNVIRALPEEITRLGLLRTLLLARNEIEELPQGLGALHGLKTLVVDDNPLQKLPESLGGLGSLAALHLNETGLTRLSDVILELKALEHLGLHRSAKAPAETRIHELPEELLEMHLSSIEIGGNALFCRGGGEGTLPTSSDRALQGFSGQYCESANGAR
jgi:hypothetical protein